ncbi:MAG TPA: glutamine-hydrolyzing carbamoyl-phosphate synthase small subunit [Syntrophales bacterium]|nr:glutamine-hydrolyzing carbamoyl-phosphate synthase small subunit [Syntrophales bacterium]HOL58967.1 glutamine-hydrolyzing carbamoyl-phosphate synthase small subunit [Syntrophales bacterium]HPO34755.1 glutamine-hydrolyzing carbamoyl-phosphate synthase small subunit [Syntrophales bacterium]
MAVLRKGRKAVLLLEDGSVWWGQAFAGSGEAVGEVVFNTGLTGYQEVLTDPSYKDQIVVMTYPMIGNYGTNDEDMESAGIYLEGFIVKEYHGRPSNWRSKRTLKDFLEAWGKIGIEGIDTRAVTRRIRIYGAMRGIVSSEDFQIDSLTRKLSRYPGLVGRDLVREVTSRVPYVWLNGRPCPDLKRWPEGKHLRVAVLDCGVKFNILRMLEERGCGVMVFPAFSSAEEILSHQPDGVLLSNGPGDPAALPYVVETARRLLGQVPIFGICLGHQILGQAMGGRTEKLKFGHHGVNQPVKNHLSGRVEITSQNHGFVVIPGSVAGEVLATHENLNDRTSEGISYPRLRAFSVQYHPEASPGPHDAAYLFDYFIDLMKGLKA